MLRGSYEGNKRVVLYYLDHTKVRDVALHESYTHWKHSKATLKQSISFARSLKSCYISFFTGPQTLILINLWCFPYSHFLLIKSNLLKSVLLFHVSPQAECLLYSLTVHSLSMSTKIQSSTQTSRTTHGGKHCIFF